MANFSQATQPTPLQATQNDASLRSSILSSFISFSSSDNSRTKRTPEPKPSGKNYPSQLRCLVLQHIFSPSPTPHNGTQCLLPMVQFLENMLRGRDCRLLYPDDSIEYRELLEKSLVGRLEGAKEFKVNVPMDAPNDLLASTMSDIVHRVIKSIFAASAKPFPSHMLAQGYRKLRDQAGCGMPGVIGIENHFPNTLVNSIKTPKWELLLSRIGEESMVYLLTHTCIFVGLRNQCYYQLTGPPVSEIMGTRTNLECQVTTAADRSIRKSVAVPASLHSGPRASVSGHVLNELNANDRNGDHVDREMTSTMEVSETQETEQPEVVDRATAVRRDRRKNYRQRKRIRGVEQSKETDMQSQISGAIRDATNASVDPTEERNNDIVNISPSFPTPSEEIDTPGRIVENAHSETSDAVPHRRPLRGKKRKREVPECEPTDVSPAVAPSGRLAGGSPPESNASNKRSKVDSLTSSTLSVQKADREMTEHVSDGEVVVVASHPASIGSQDNGVRKPLKSRAKRPRKTKREAKTPTKNAEDTNRSPGCLTFFRSRLFYARPVYTAKKTMAFGLPKIHVLNRYRHRKASETSKAPVKEATNKDAKTARKLDPSIPLAPQIIRYIFPRQFGLDNVFTSAVDKSVTAQPVQEYLFREEEIAKSKTNRIPWRLRPFLPLLERVIQKHNNCNYSQLLLRHCPLKPSADVQPAPILPVSNGPLPQPYPPSDAIDADGDLDMDRGMHTEPPLMNRHEEGTEINEAEVSEKSLIGKFSTYHEVTAYVHSIFRHVIPLDVWGSRHNQNIIANAAKRFVRLRRYETMSIHEVLQGFKLNECKWLVPQLTNDDSEIKVHHLAPTDSQKRGEILAELVYWLFDSFLVPLLKTNFYATESAPHRNRVFYFRQDLWAKISKPVMTRFATTIFQQIDQQHAQRILSNRTLQFSYVRLLPKESGVRPIINLRRRIATSKIVAGQKKVLGPSINSILQNAFQILSFEKSRKPQALGGSVLGQNEIYERLKQFKSKIGSKLERGLPMYFAKVDVRCSFDSIEQTKLLSIIRNILSESEYMIQKYSVLFPSAGKLRKSFMRRVRTADEFHQFPDIARHLAKSLRHAVLVDQVVYSYEQRQAVLQLLEEHIKDNLIKIGKKFYRQVVGIPQGSVLSTLLCSYFYGELEKDKLSFISEDEDGILLRYVDDFLYISSRKDRVQRFMEVMTAGHPSYGTFINHDKTLCNFDTTVDGRPVSRVRDQHGQAILEFPWCGILIHTRTLDVKGDYSRYTGSYVNDTLTVETSRQPGKALLYKLVQMLKPKFHVMFLDVTLNSINTVLLNVYQNLMLCAMKYHHYVSQIPYRKDRYLTETVYAFFKFAFVLLKSRTQSKAALVGECRTFIPEGTVTWLGAHAFRKILTRKQTQHSILLASLEQTLKDVQYAGVRRRLQAVVDPNRSQVFDSLLY